MFNFHKPRTYRSAEGCCICRAKSSSSRFTDSRKYERDTMQCFDLKYPRTGEICNACVLLVKRYKRLPVGSKRNWSHVVDARAGPGSSKIQTKYKSDRGTSRSSSSHQSSNSSSNSGANSSSYMPEKYSKIFKKTKKIKDSSTHKPRKSSSNGWSLSAAGTHSLPTTPDSLDSDYEDSRLHGSLSGTGGSGGVGGLLGGTVVQFQTQTRASAFRAQVAAEARRRYLKLGSKRRKCLPPRKNRRSNAHESTINFFDEEEEWHAKQTCCGVLYECPALGGALILDVDNYKPCEKHQNLNVAVTAANEETKDRCTTKPAIQHSIPAVVQLQTSTSCSSTTSLYERPLGGVTTTAAATTITPVAAATSASSSTPSSLTITKTSTPVLKKHHLFFKRQSECFPQGDMVTASETNYYNTESDYNNHNTTQQQQQQQQQFSQQQTPNSACLNMPKHSLAKVTTISPTPLSANYHQQQHAMNSSSSSSTITKTSSSTAHHNFLHKIKTADTGKIVKHSLEKFNTAVRLKTNDIHDMMKPIIKTVDKSYILSKPPTMAASINSLHNAGVSVTMASSNGGGTTTTYQNLASYNSMAQPPLTTASMSAASPTSSTSSTSSSSTKFSDNSSDSGFDENMLLERKSASPLQDDCEKKMLSRHGVQTMFLASGVQIQGQAQNLVLTGNEVAAKILQNRKYTSVSTSATNGRLSSSHPTTTAVKIAQISTGNNGSNNTTSSSSSAAAAVAAAQAKMRAIYNSSNTIQHENGITTIVPASSLAASSQLAAMQNIAQAQAQVTITPAPPTSLSANAGQQFNVNAQNIISSRKLTAANIINLQSNNLSNTTTIQHGSNSSSSSSANHQLNSATTTTPNQKIILLKTTTSAAASVSSHQSMMSLSASSAITTGAKFNTTMSSGGNR
ncbi:serine-rich adhesin for platelets [Musca vetustissima]|uniref:serine-rich adhesin for platelets n=1 Tax=Musca vetustissima TaxID=27455 RepID=UPI002AB76E3E|nr:serine-rich adhesin for platelets [Musca vetustissima]